MGAEYPYRTNVKPQQAEPPLPFNKQYPKCWRLVQWLIGAVGIGIVGGIVWLLFPGVYYLGGWLDSKFLHWDLESISMSPSRWLVGFAALLLTSALIFLPRRVGKWLIG